MTVPLDELVALADQFERDKRLAHGVHLAFIDHLKWPTGHYNEEPRELDRDEFIEYLNRHTPRGPWRAAILAVHDGEPIDDLVWQAFYAEEADEVTRTD